jgi:hypothetical protein
VACAVPPFLVGVAFGVVAERLLDLAEWIGGDPFTPRLHHEDWIADGAPAASGVLRSGGRLGE